MDLQTLSVDELLRVLHDNSMFITFIGVAACLFKKDKRALRYALLCAFFYVLGSFTYPLIIEFDAESRIFRYIYWAFSDVVFMGILAYWALKDKMYIWQSVIAQLIVLPGPILQLFRLVDRHLLDLSYSTYPYKTVIPLINIAIVLLCFAPLFIFSKERKDQEVIKY